MIKKLDTSDLLKLPNGWLVDKIQELIEQSNRQNEAVRTLVTFLYLDPLGEDSCKKILDILSSSSEPKS